MDPSQPEDNFDEQARSDTAIAGNLSLVADIATSFRRVKADESYDDKGVRTIWHQGRLRTEMLSWENEKGIILKQELTLFGMLVEFRQGKPLRTGRVPLDDSQTGGGRPMSHMVKMDEAPVSRTLDYASHLLKHASGRDFYAQHMLKQVNETLNTSGFDDGRTQVSSLDPYDKRPTSLDTVITQPSPVLPPKKTGNRALFVGLLVLAAALLAFGAALHWS